MKQMFDICEKLIAEPSDEIYGVNTINWEDSTWKHLSLIGDEEVISLSHAKVYAFSASVLRLGKMNECELSAILVSISARRFSPRRWSFLGHESEKKWFSTHESKPQGEWD